MAVGEEKRQAQLLHLVEAGDQNHDVLIGYLLDAIPARMDVAQHHREGCEVERNEVAQHATRRHRNLMRSALVDKLCIANTDPARRANRGVAAVQTVLQHPGQIAPMQDAPDQSLLRV